MSRDLCRDPHEFAFFQAIRILERLVGGAALGGTGAAAERIRLRPSTSLAFAPADVAEVEELADPGAEAAGKPRYRLTTRFLGLYGVTSPLPTHYAEDVAQGDPGANRVRDFLDLFHHRLLSLLHRAWARQHYLVAFASDGSDDLSRRLLAWTGWSPSLVERLQLAPLNWLRYAGLLLGRSRPPRALEIFWGELVEAPVEVMSNVGRWVEVPADQQALLGKQSMELGRDFVIGRRSYDLSGSFRITVGPLSHQAFERFLPGGPMLERLREGVALALPSPLSYQVELRLQADDLPPWRLGTPRPNRLGWTTWPGTEPAAPARDGVVRLQATS